MLKCTVISIVRLICLFKWSKEFTNANICGNLPSELRGSKSPFKISNVVSNMFFLEEHRSTENANTHMHNFVVHSMHMDIQILRITCINVEANKK